MRKCDIYYTELPECLFIWMEGRRRRWSAGAREGTNTAVENCYPGRLVLA